MNLIDSLNGFDPATYWLTRLCFQRALAFIYLMGFLIAVNQYCPLLGENGLLPVRLFLGRVQFWDAPSLFWANCSNTAFTVVAWIGVILSLAALSGVSERFGIYVSTGVWLLLWGLYLSFVNVGQVFYGFGWESLLLETGFLAIFLGSADVAPPKIIFWLLRWVLFRVMFGAGMIKLRGDPCWRDLTCMMYHYETQPLPNPLSWWLHQLPAIVHKGEVLFTHIVELVVPWGYFGPRPVAAIAGALTILFQATLIVSGNLSWLNYITIVLGIACFNDSLLLKIFSMPQAAAAAERLSTARFGVAAALTLVVLLLSIRPARNLFSSRQLMNASFEPFHLVNTYGAFGSVTRERMEVILEGTDEAVILPTTKWRAYEFKGKPGDPSRIPCVVSPYHYKIDWQMWFAAMTEYWRHPWILNLVAKLLRNDEAVLGLISHSPFPKEPPRFIRAGLYRYEFTRWGSGDQNWWKRTYVEPYLPPLSLEQASFRNVLRDMRWE